MRGPDRLSSLAWVLIIFALIFTCLTVATGSIAAGVLALIDWALLFGVLLKDGYENAER